LKASHLVVFAPDLHFPLVDWPTWKALLDFIGRNKVNGFIFGGDQFDNAEISHHNHGKHLFKPTGAFKRNEQRFEAEILTPLEKHLKRADKHWIVGNHDRWELDLDETQPELQGCFDRTQNLKLKSRGWKIVPNCKSMSVGKLIVCHGDSLSSGFGAGTFPTRKAIDVYMKSVLFGHVHYAQSFSKVSPVEHSQKYMAWSSPALCKTNPAYMKNRPSSWVNGFTAIELLQGGNFNCYPIVVTKGRFSFGGRVYGSK